MYGVVLAFIFIIPFIKAFRQNKVVDMCWWGLFVLINVMIGLTTFIKTELNTITNLLSNL